VGFPGLTQDENWDQRYTHLLFERRAHGVLLVTINRPEQGNAVNPRLHVELGQLWRDVDLDERVAVAVITGAGETFCSGGEITSFGATDNPGSESIDRSMHEVGELVNGMIECRKPIVSAVNGLAMASGLALALSADISVVGENVKLNDGHLRGGMVAGDHAALLWPLYTSLAKARYYLLTGDSLTGREAERIGLVSVCVPDLDVLERALSIAERIATNAQFATRWTKRALNAWVRQQAPLFELSTALQMLSLHGADMQVALAAIADGRKPKFPSILP
jgi:enoyl-CoA hydratase